MPVPTPPSASRSALDPGSPPDAARGWRAALQAACLAGAMAWLSPPAQAVQSAPSAQAAQAAQAAAAARTKTGTPSDLALAWAQQVRASGDHGGRPFAVVDKQSAQLSLHAANGALVAVAPVLLGRQRGDHSTDGVGHRTQAGTLRREDMTTPAGRFVAYTGPNKTGERVLWLDQATAFALHRLRQGPQERARHQALASADPKARRMSAGCVVVTGEFFDQVVAPLFSSRGGVVYVLPERATADLAGLQARQAAH